MLTISPELQHKLESQVLSRTGGRIRNLSVELRSDQVILRGETASWHVKQLAQQSVRDVLPAIDLCNAIVVARA